MKYFPPFEIDYKRKLLSIKRAFNFLFGCLLDVEEGEKEIRSDEQTNVASIFLSNYITLYAND